MNIKYTKNSDWLKHFNRLKNRSIFKTDTKLSEKSQTEKDKYHMISLICGIFKK